MGEGGLDEEVASSKKKTRVKKSKMDTLFMTKKAANWLKSISNL